MKKNNSIAAPSIPAIPKVITPSNQAEVEPSRVSQFKKN